MKRRADQLRSVDNIDEAVGEGAASDLNRQDVENGDAAADCSTGAVGKETVLDGHSSRVENVEAAARERNDWDRSRSGCLG